MRVSVHPHRFQTMLQHPIWWRHWERLVLGHLCPVVSSAMHPLQFAWHAGIGLEDAVIYLLHGMLTHLEKHGSSVRILFFYFPWRSIPYSQCCWRTNWRGLPGVFDLTEWILDYLTNRPQFGRAWDCVSDLWTCSVGAPQGLSWPSSSSHSTLQTSQCGRLCSKAVFDCACRLPYWWCHPLQGTDARLVRGTGVSGTTFSSTLEKPRRCNWSTAPAPVNIQGTKIESVDS